MEDKELQSLWKKSFDNFEGTYISSKEINAIKQRNSSSIIERYRLTIVVEALVTFTLYTVLFSLNWFNIKYAQSTTFTVTVLAVLVYYSIFVYTALRQIKIAKSNTFTLDYFKKIIKVMKRFEQHYKFMNYVYIPIGTAIGFWLGFSQKNNFNALSSTSIIAIGVLLLVFAGIIILVSNWYVWQLYGKKIRSLNELIVQWEDEII
jgi:hypothetical protein